MIIMIIIIIIIIISSLDVMRKVNWDDRAKSRAEKLLRGHVPYKGENFHSSYVGKEEILCSLGLQILFFLQKTRTTSMYTSICVSRPIIYLSVNHLSTYLSIYPSIYLNLLRDFMEPTDIMETGSPNFAG
jgi:hypothetical protein